MSFDVVKDAEDKVAVLIDPEAGRALGPMLASDLGNATALLETFVGGLDKDPAAVNPIDLARAFDGFLDAIAEPAAPASPPETAAAAVAAAPESAPAAPPAAGAPAPATEAALPGETGGLAGPPGGSGTAPGPGGGSAEAVDGPVVATGVLPVENEQARPPDPTSPTAHVEPEVPAPAEGAAPAEPAAPPVNPQ